MWSRSDVIGEKRGRKGNRRLPARASPPSRHPSPSQDVPVHHGMETDPITSWSSKITAALWVPLQSHPPEQVFRLAASPLNTAGRQKHGGKKMRLHEYRTDWQEWLIFWGFSKKENKQRRWTGKKSQVENHFIGQTDKRLDFYLFFFLVTKKQKPA